jgi:hypothetical protein
LYPRPKCAFSEAVLQWYWYWGRGVPSERGWEGALSCLPWWGGRGRGTGSSQNTCHLSWVTRYLLPMLSLHDQSRGPWILLHVVSGPWTFFVAALDKGQCRKAVCRRYSYFNRISGVYNHLVILNSLLNVLHDFYYFCHDLIF